MENFLASFFLSPNKSSNTKKFIESKFFFNWNPIFGKARNNLNNALFDIGSEMKRTSDIDSAKPTSGKKSKQTGQVYVGQKRRGTKSAKREDVKNIDVTSGSRNKLNDATGTTLSPLYLRVEVAKINGQWLCQEEVKDWSAVIDKKLVPFEHLWQGRKVTNKQINNTKSNGATTCRFGTNSSTGARIPRHLPIGFTRIVKQHYSKNVKRTQRKVFVRFRFLYRFLRFCVLQTGFRRPRAIVNLIARQKKKDISAAKQTPKPRGHWFADRLLGYEEARRQLYAPIYTRLIQPLPFFKGIVALVHSGQSVMIKDYDGPTLELHPQGLLISTQVCETAKADLAHPYGHGYEVALAVFNA